MSLDLCEFCDKEATCDCKNCGNSLCDDHAEGGLFYGLPGRYCYMTCFNEAMETREPDYPEWRGDDD